MREVTPHYEAGLGIRPPRKGGRVRGVAHEVVVGGGMELWHCDHDHAPGVRNCQQLTDVQRAEAQECSRAWIQEQIEQGRLYPMPVWAEGEGPQEEPLVMTIEALEALANGDLP